MSRSPAVVAVVVLALAGCSSRSRPPVEADRAPLVITGATAVAEPDYDDNAQPISGGGVAREPRTPLFAPWTGDGTAVLPAPARDLAAVTYRGYVFALGGADASGNASAEVSSSLLSSAGEPQGALVVQAPLNAPRFGAAAVVYRGRIYVFGGADAVNGGVPGVEVAQPDGTGDVTGWTDGGALPAPGVRAHAAAVASRGFIYLVGGDDGTGVTSGYLTDVAWAPVNPDGTLGAWQSAALPTNPKGSAKRSRAGAAVLDGELYVAGGTDGTFDFSDVWRASLAADGSLGAWEAMPSLATGRSAFALLPFGGHLVAAGGRSGGAPLASVEVLTAFDDGEVAPWRTLATGLAVPRAGAASYVAGGKVHLLGGGNDGGLASDFATGGASTLELNTTSLNFDGGLIGGGWDFAPATQDNGYLYIAGGAKSDVATVRGDVFSARLLPNGTLANESIATGVLPVPVCWEGAAAYDGELYLAGGVTGLSPNFGGQPVTATGDFQHVGLHSDGTLDTPVTEDGWVLADAGWRNKLIAHDGSVYWVGGKLTNSQNNVAGAWQGIVAGPGQVTSWSYVSYNGATSNSDMGVVVRNGVLASQSPNNTAGYVAVHGSQLAGPGSTGPSLGNDPLGTAWVDDDGTVLAFGGYFSGSNRSVSLARAFRDGGLEAFQHGTNASAPTSYEGAVLFNGRAVETGGNEYGDNSNPNVFNSYQVTDFALPGALGGWSAGTSLTGHAHHRGGGASWRDFAYVVGGLDPQGASVEVGAVLSDGGVRWQPSGATLPAAVDAPGVAAAGGWLYVVGGAIGSGPVADAWAFPLFLDGGVGAPLAANGGLLTARSEAGAAIAQGTLYVVGGVGANGFLRGVESAPVYGDGGLGAFTAAANLPLNVNGFPGARARAAVLARNGVLSVIGGELSPGDAGTNQTLEAVLGDGGAISGWITGPGLPGSRVGSAAAAYGDHVYLLGGCRSAETPCGTADGTRGPLQSVLAAPIYGDGTLGEWKDVASLQSPTAEAQAAAVHGRLVLFGGTDTGLSASALPQSTSVRSSPVSGEVSVQLDLGGEVIVDSVTLTPPSAGGARWGAYRLAYRTVEQGAFGPRVDLGPVQPGVAVAVDDGPASGLELDVSLDDAQAMALDPGGERDLSRIDVASHVVGVTTSSSSGSTGATGSSSTGASSNSSSSGSASTSSSGSGSASTSSSGSGSTSSASGGTSSSSSGSSTGTGSTGASSTGTGSSSGHSASAGSTGGSGSTDLIGCACSAGSGPEGAAWLGLGLLALGLRRRRSSALLLVALLAVAGRAEARSKKPKVAVMALGCPLGVDPKVGQVITDRLAAQVQARSGAEVMSPQDVQNMLGFERSKELLGCGDSSCMTQIAGALGVDLLVSGSLAKVGKSVTFEAQLMDPAKAEVLLRYSGRVKGGDDEALLDEADKAAAALFPKPIVASSDAAAATSTPNSTTTTTTTSTTTAAPSAPSTATDSGLIFSLGGAQELTAKGGWGQLRAGYRFSPAATLSLGGLYTGAKKPGAELDVSSIPVLADAVVKPVVGLSAVALFDDSTHFGVAPHIGAEWMPTSMFGVQLEVPLLFVLNAPSGAKTVYPLASGSVVFRI